jgi:5-methylcytosine-specific restriction endonuclease McrA
VGANPSTGIQRRNIMDTLVLDQNYAPVAKIDWQRAITLLWQGKVEVIEEYEDREIRSVTFSIKMPSIVRFLRAMRGKKKAIKFSRENVYARDKGKCQYCGTRVGRHEATYDHVTPKAQGGNTNWENIVICCVPCNQDKGNRTPSQAKMRLLSTPVKPKRLPDGMTITLMWRKNEPISWKQFLTDMSYWNGELESD